MEQSKDGAALAGCIGRYRERRPPPPLDRHFRCSWSNRLPPHHQGAVAVVPDGCVDLLWTDGRLIVAGPDETVALTPLAAGATVTGLRFRPGSAAGWLGLPMSEIVGQRVELGELWGARARELADRVGETAGRMAGETDDAARLEAELSRLVPGIGEPMRDMAHLFLALGRRRTLVALRDELGISERTLRRRCHEAFGYGPKTLDRILRFQRFLRLARRPNWTGSGGTGLAGLADAAGYADQAHLTREVRRLSGLVPSAILRQYDAPA